MPAWDETFAEPPPFDQTYPVAEGKAPTLPYVPAPGGNPDQQSFADYLAEHPTETDLTIKALTPLAKTPEQQDMLGRFIASRKAPELDAPGLAGQLWETAWSAPKTTTEYVRTMQGIRQNDADTTTKMRQVAQAHGLDPDKIAPLPSMVSRLGGGAFDAVEDLALTFQSPAGALTLGTSALPKATQRFISLGFASQMLSQAPDKAQQLLQEINKPDGERDYRKIASLTVSGAADVGLGSLALAHSAGVQLPSPVQTWNKANAAADQVAGRAAEWLRNRPITPEVLPAEPPRVRPVDIVNTETVADADQRQLPGGQVPKLLPPPPPFEETAPAPEQNEGVPTQDEPKPQQIPTSIPPTPPSVPTEPMPKFEDTKPVNEPPAAPLQPVGEPEVVENTLLKKGNVTPLVKIMAGQLDNGNWVSNLQLNHTAGGMGTPWGNESPTREEAIQAAVSHASDWVEQQQGRADTSPKDLKHLDRMDARLEAVLEQLAPAPVDKPAEEAQPKVTSNEPLPDQQRADTELQPPNPPQLDVREPAGPRAPAPPVGGTNAAPGRQVATGPAPGGGINEGTGIVATGGGGNSGERVPVPGGRPSIPGQPAGAGAPGGATGHSGKPPVIDYSPEAAAKRIAWRNDLHDLGPGSPGGMAGRWQAIENTYLHAKHASQALPNTPGKDIFSIVVKSSGPFPKSPVVDHIFVHRDQLNAVMNSPEFLQAYPPGKFSTAVDPGNEAYRPKKGEPSYREWLERKRPDTTAPEPKSEPPTPPKATTEADKNHVLPKDEDWIPTGDKAKATANLAAIKLLKQLEAENRNPTPEEKTVLAKYTGWGGLKEVFDEGKAYYRQRPPWNEDQKREFANWEKGWGKLYDEVKAALTPEEHAAAGASILNAHYTSREIINQVWAAAKHLGFVGGKALEPAAGVGNFMGLTPDSVRNKTRWTAVELDNVSARILQKLYPQALVHQMGFEDAKIPSNSQDLVISNVPFAKDGPRDERYPTGLSLHNYFFARALDLVKPGGIVVAITSDSTMDSPASRKAREYMTEKADLVGAIRLPNNAFKKNAGTEVTTDILFLRKRDGTPFTGQPFQSTVPVPISRGEPVNVNEYFAQHPDMMLGRMSREGTMYRGDQQALVPTPGDLNAKLAEAIQKLPPNVLGATTTPEEVAAPPMERAEAGTKLGQLIAREDGVYQVQPDGTLGKPEWAGDAKKMAQAQRYVALRDHARSHIGMMLDENATDADIKASMKRLNVLYDDYVKKHGPLSDSRGKSRFLNDDVDFPLVMALEDENTTLVSKTQNGKEVVRRVRNYTKSKMFTERTVYPRRPPARVDTVADALQVSQNFAGRVDPEYMAKLTGKPVEAVKQELVTMGAAFENPKTGLWEGREQYLSGFVKNKLREAVAAAKDNPLYLKNVAELTKVQPPPVPFSDIGFKLGSVWIPPKVIERFLQDVLDVPAEVNYTEQTGGWTVTPKSGQYGDRNVTTFGIHGWKGTELVEQSLNLRSATVTKTVPGENGKTSEVKDNVRSLEAQEKQAALQKEFKKYVQSKTDITQELAQIYNGRFNGVVKTKYEAPTWAHYPGAASDVQLRPHQKAVVTRMLQNSTLLAHAVGTGKTYAMVTAAMEMRRLGLAKKPMIVVQNATLEQFARSFKRLYPTARILCPSPKQRAAQERQRTMSRIATGDWDCVVVPQSWINMMPDDPVREQKYLNDRIKELEAAQLAAAYESGKRSPKAADLERAIKALQERVENLMSRKQDNVLTFEQTGVDALFVDEAHAYKKLVFTTQMDNVKGLDKGASQRGQSMYFKTRWVQEKNQGRNVIFATGTPVSNTLAEAWNMMRYLRPDVLKEYGIEKFDDFASTFGDTKTDLEMTAGGSWKPVTRFARFTNGPELIAAWRAVADVVTPEEVNLPGLPSLKTGKAISHTIAMTPTLRKYIEWIKEQLERFAAMSGKEKKENSHIPLVMFTLAKKASLDMRMINPQAGDEPGSKLNVAADEVARIYADSTAVNGAQMVFADLYQDNPENPGFNAYDELKQKLVERGIPEKEILVVTPDVKDAKREALFAKLNDGEIRVAIGSTEKMGVGVNAQEHLVALHHLDCPPRPMDIEQRNGRIVRQGNNNPEVEIHNYGVEKSLDAAMYQKNATKQQFINQILRGDIHGRSFEDAANEQSLSFEEMMAAFSGDPRALEKVALENQLRSLEALKSGHYAQVADAHDKIAYMQAKGIPYKENELARARANAAKYAKAFNGDFKLEAGNRKVEGKKEVTAALDELFTACLDRLAGAVKATATGKVSVPLGEFTLNGRRVTLAGYAPANDKGIPEMSMAYMIWQFEDNQGGRASSGAGFFHSLSAVLERVAGEPEQIERGLESERRNLRELESFVKTPFEREAELDATQKRLIALEAELKAAGEAESAAAQAKLRREMQPGEDEDGETETHGMASGARPKSTPKAARPKPVTVASVQQPASDLMKDVNRFRAATAPQTLGDVARFAANLLRQLNAELANEEARADAALQPFRNSFDRTPVPKKWKFDPTLPLPRNLAFIAAYEGGNAAVLGPTEAAAADEFARQNEAWLDRVRALGTGALENIITNYFPHLWDDPEGAKRVIAASLAQRPLQGSRSFMKQRTHELFLDGLAAGLRPVHDNPVDLWMLKRREIARYVMGVKFCRMMQAAGLMQFVHAFRKAPDGWSTFDDRAFQVYGPPTVTIKEAFDAGMREATLDVLRSLGVPMERLAKIGGGHWGYETHQVGQQGKERIVTKFGGPDWVIWHELGHVLDNRYPDMRQMVSATDQMQDELRTLADLRFEGQTPSQNFQRYVRSWPEKMAVILQAYLHAPERMQAVAPAVKQAFEGFLRAHPELDKINDIQPGLRLGEAETQQNVGGLVKLGNYYLPDQAAAVVRNYLSPGLNPHLWYRTLRGTSHLLNGVQLGLSAFHLGFTTLDAAVSRLAIGLEDVAAGRLGMAVRTFASVPVSPVTNFMAGARLRSAVLENLTTGEMGQLVKALEAGGGRIGQDKFWQTEFTRRMVRAFHSGSLSGYATAGANAPFAIVEQMMRPVMEIVVPRQKLGVFAEMAKRELLNLGDNASPEDVREAMRKAWDSVDNRMGQVVYDNLFYNRSLKDLVLLTFRAYGWQLGKYREGIGGGIDTVRLLKYGSQRLLGQAPAGKAEFTHRMAYVPALLLTVGLLGGLTTFLATGTRPTGKDWWMPRIGGTDQNGNPLRVNFPSYVKDALAYAKHPVTSLGHALNPLVSAVMDLVGNRDFYDVRIRNPDDPIWKQGSDVAQWAARETVPFSVSAVRQMQKDQTPAWKQVAPFFGVTPVPARMTMTPAQELAAEITAAAMPSEPRTRESYDRSQLIKQIVRDIKGARTNAVAELRGGLDKGILNEAAATTLIDRLQYSPLQFQVHNMTPPAAMRVWRVANPQERAQLQPMIQAKVANSVSLSLADKMAYLRELR